MISSLAGRLASKAPTHITVDVHGVGYEVFIPLSTYYVLPDLNEDTALAIYTHLREDAIQLYGFFTSMEKEAFILLTTVSGIGPKLGLSVLSALSVPDLVSAIQGGDLDKLETVPGIGKKSAARIVLELKDKLERMFPVRAQAQEVAATPEDRLRDDAMSALINLGYRPAEVKDSLKRITRDRPEPQSLKELIREVLKDLARG
jgi:Holliday junction DNA helicase RuvA